MFVSVQTCQVSRIGRDSHTFKGHLTLSSTLTTIPKKSHTFSQMTVTTFTIRSAKYTFDYRMEELYPEPFSPPFKRTKLTGAATYGTKFKPEWVAEFPFLTEGQLDPVYNFHCKVISVAGIKA